MMRKKNIFSFIMIAVLILAFTACRSRAPTHGEQASTDDRSSDTTVAQTIEKQPLSDEENAWIVQNLNEFAFRSTPAVIAVSENSNTLYSPAGLYIALSMLVECADGDTETEILDLLQPVEPGAQLDMGSLLNRNMVFQNKNGRQSVDNSIWLVDNCEIADNIRETLARVYGVEYFALDPQNPDDMADWAGERTLGDLPRRDDPLSDDIAMVIINLLSFKDSWQIPFDEGRTSQDVFTLTGGETCTADYMHAGAERPFIQSDTFAAAAYNFSSGAKIHFILPNEGVTPEDLLADSAVISSAINYNAADNPYIVSPGRVSYKIPKISFTSSMDLTEAMQGLGMVSAFDGGFPSILSPSGPVAVDAIYQDCYFAMDEKGAVAEAKTEIHMTSSAAPPPEEQPLLLELHLTRPFLFVITSPEGYVTFVGVVNMPD